MMKTMVRMFLCLGLLSVALAQSSIAVAPRSLSATGAADIRIGRAQDVHALGELLYARCIGSSGRIRRA